MKKLISTIIYATIIITILNICSFSSLYALDTKYIPEQSLAACSINVNQVLQKLDRQSMSILIEEMSSNSPIDFYMMQSLISGRSGVDPKDSVYISVVDTDTAIIMISLKDSSLFKDFLIDEYEFVPTMAYGDYYALQSSDEEMFVAFNDDIAIIMNIDTYNPRAHNEIASDVFSSNKKSDTKFDGLKNNKHDMLIISDSASLLSIIDEEVEGLEQRYEVSLNFNKNDITLDIDIYDYNKSEMLKSIKPFNKSLYKYNNGNNTIGFISLSTNMELLYAEIKTFAKSIGSAQELREFEDTAIEEFSMSVSQILEAYTGNIFLSLWDFDMGESTFDGILSIEINNQIYLQKIIDVLLYNDVLEESSIFGEVVYETNDGSFAIYQEGNILYMSNYNIIRDILNKDFKSSSNKNITTLADKNMACFYVDLQKLISIFKSYDKDMLGSDAQHNIISKLNSFSIIANDVNKNHSKVSTKLELRDNKSNSINWLILLLSNI